MNVFERLYSGEGITHIKIHTQPTLMQAYMELMERSGTAQIA